MAQVGDTDITDKYALYCGDAIEVTKGLPDNSVDFSVYSLPYGGDRGGLFKYSSSPHDLSNSFDYETFLRHYEHLVIEKTRLTPAGRLTAVECADVTRGGRKGFIDFPGDVLRLHEKHGWIYHDRKYVWKEPLKVAIRTRALGLRHSQIEKDSSLCHSASAAQLVIMRMPGTNAEPIAHPEGLTDYAGEFPIWPPEAGWQDVWAEMQRKYQGWKDGKTNRLSQAIWRRYASAFWDDIRLDRVLPYKAARDPDDIKHIHPLQLDVIDRSVTLWSNPGDVVATFFMGVGSEVYSATRAGRKAVGVELKPTYYRQAVRNVEAGVADWRDLVEQETFDFVNGGPVLP